MTTDIPQPTRDQTSKTANPPLDITLPFMDDNRTSIRAFETELSPATLPKFGSRGNRGTVGEPFRLSRCLADDCHVTSMRVDWVGAIGGGRLATAWHSTPDV